MDREVGKCSLCGGPVTVPETWMGVNPPKPRCQSCGATMVTGGPVIEMELKPHISLQIGSGKW